MKQPKILKPGTEVYVNMKARIVDYYKHSDKYRVAIAIDAAHTSAELELSVDADKIIKP